MTLLICRTCPRYDTRASGQFGRLLTVAIDRIARSRPAATVGIRNVVCLGGCPDDGVIALDGHQKARVRFTGLDASHAGAVLDAAAAHDACPTGVPADWVVPPELVDRLSAVTLKRGPAP